MPRRTKARITRRRVFVGCEGESERSYAGFLLELANGMGLSLNFDRQLCLGGDHLAVVERAVDTLRRQTQRHGRFWKSAVLLDSDRRHEHPERTRQADRLIAQFGLLPIWSNPCLEALYLRHFPGCEHLSPPTSNLAIQELLNRWPEYEKPMSIRSLRTRLEIAHVQRAAGTSPDLRRFLRELWFPLHATLPFLKEGSHRSS